MDILSFERKYAVTRPPIVRDFFNELNGTIQGKLGMDDENLIGFWHLDEVRPLDEECPDYTTPEEPNLFIFADHCIWAHAYAMRLASGPNIETAIFLIGLAQPLKIAGTFEEFLRRYAAGDQSVLFPRIESARE